MLFHSRDELDEIEKITWRLETNISHEMKTIIMIEINEIMEPREETEFHKR